MIFKRAIYTDASIVCIGTKQLLCNNDDYSDDVIDNDDGDDVCKDDNPWCMHAVA